MIQQTGQRIARGLGQEVCARVGVGDREPCEVGEDAEPLLHIAWQLLLGGNDSGAACPFDLLAPFVRAEVPVRATIASPSKPSSGRRLPTSLPAMRQEP